MEKKSLVVAPLKKLAREAYRRIGARRVVERIGAVIVLERFHVERRVTSDGEELVADGERVVIRTPETKSR